MALGKVLTNGYFWTIIAAVMITVWICNTSPQNLDKFSQIIANESSIARAGRGKKKGKGRRRGTNVHEEKCRDIFEKIFQTNFPTTRKVKWLRNPETNRPLELDGFNPYIKTPIGTGLAFEYDGAQHAAPNGHFHGMDAVKEFSSQFRRDQYKSDLCKKHRVMLIRIHHLVDFDQLENFIRKKLEKEGFIVGKNGTSGARIRKSEREN